jgi:hypothetical protein
LLASLCNVPCSYLRQINRSSLSLGAGPFKISMESWPGV